MHNHTAKTLRKMPFNGITQSICSCGARKMSDNSAVSGGTRDATGWYIAIRPDAHAEALNRLLNEGCVEPPESHDPEDYFDVVGNE